MFAVFGDCQEQNISESDLAVLHDYYTECHAVRFGGI